MKRKATMMSAALLAFSALIWGLAPLSEAAPKVSWNFHTVLGKVDTMVVQGEQWAIDEIKKATNGEVEMTVFEKSTLGFAGPDMWEVVGKGLLPIAEMWGPHVAGRYPWIIPFELPFVYDVSKIDLTNQVFDKVWDYYSKPLLKDNLVLLGITVLPVGRGFTVNKPLQSNPKAPWKGMKIRCSGPVPTWVTETLGGTPVVMDYAEVYEAGMRGMVDGMDSAVNKGFYSMKFHEVFKKIMVTDPKNYIQFMVGTTTFMIVANKDKLESLPKETQEIIKDRMKKGTQRMIKFYKQDAQDAVKDGPDKYGMSYELTSPQTMEHLKAEAPKYWETWKKKGGDQGVKILEEGLKVIKAYKP
jgi:TRAP-type transport system periplasmic protein